MSVSIQRERRSLCFWKMEGALNLFNDYFLKTEVKLQRVENLLCSMVIFESIVGEV